MSCTWLLEGRSIWGKLGRWHYLHSHSWSLHSSNTGTNGLYSWSVPICSQHNHFKVHVKTSSWSTTSHNCKRGLWKVPLFPDAAIRKGTDWNHFFTSIFMYISPHYSGLLFPLSRTSIWCSEHSRSLRTTEIHETIYFSMFEECRFSWHAD